MVPMVPIDPTITYFPVLQYHTLHELLDSAEALKFE
jgi:hypothetical protein